MEVKQTKQNKKSTPQEMLTLSWVATSTNYSHLVGCLLNKNPSTYHEAVTMCFYHLRLGQVGLSLPSADREAFMDEIWSLEAI